MSMPTILLMLGLLNVLIYINLRWKVNCSCVASLAQLIEGWSTVGLGGFLHVITYFIVRQYLSERILRQGRGWWWSYIGCPASD